MIRSPTKLTYSSKRSNSFGNSKNNGIYSLQLVIVSIRGIQNIICELCGRIVNKYYYCIIIGTKFPPSSIR